MKKRNTCMKLNSLTATGMSAPTSTRTNQLILAHSTKLYEELLILLAARLSRVFRNIASISSSDICFKSIKNSSQRVACDCLVSSLWYISNLRNMFPANKLFAEIARKPLNQCNPRGEREKRPT